MAKIININPKNEIIGPTVILRVLKISGLNSVTVAGPVIKINPNTMIAKPTAISRKFIFPNFKCLLFSILSIVLFLSNVFCLISFVFRLLSFVFCLVSDYLRIIHVMRLHFQVSAYSKITRNRGKYYS